MRLNATLLTASPPPQLKGKGATSGLTPAPSPRREGSDMPCVLFVCLLVNSATFIINISTKHLVLVLQVPCTGTTSILYSRYKRLVLALQGILYSRYKCFVLALHGV